MNWAIIGVTKQGYQSGGGGRNPKEKGKSARTRNPRFSYKLVLFGSMQKGAAATCLDFHINASKIN
jgi:hypothetical protein